MLLPADCEPELKDAIRQNKAALVDAGASPGIVWTRAEIEHLVKIKRLDSVMLPLIHAAKRRFAGTITDP
jgi:hypothetical protein